MIEIGEKGRRSKYQIILAAADAGYDTSNVWKTGACRAVRSPEHDKE